MTKNWYETLLKFMIEYLVVSGGLDASDKDSPLTINPHSVYSILYLDIVKYYGSLRITYDSNMRPLVNRQSSVGINGDEHQKYLIFDLNFNFISYRVALIKDISQLP